MSQAPTVASVHCAFCSKVVVVPLAGIVIDDLESVYRCQCPDCHMTLEKDLTLEIRGVLRNAGVITVEETMACWRTVLSDDSDQALWHTMYDQQYPGSPNRPDGARPQNS